MLELNEDGYLPAGIHRYAYQDFYEQFVGGFKTSQTRNDIYNKAFSWLKRMAKIFPPVELWVNGSYVTGKVNPNDLDMVIFFDFSHITDQRIFHQLNQARDDCQRYRCDVYFASIVNKFSHVDHVNFRNYWRGQFGFDSMDVPKGIIVLDWLQVHEHIRGAQNAK